MTSRPIPQPGSSPSSPTARERFHRAFLQCLVVALCVVAVLAIGALIGGTIDDTAGMVLLSAVIAALMSLAGLAGASVLGRDPVREVLGRATAGGALVVTGSSLSLIWGLENDALAHATAGLFLLTLAGVHCSLTYGRLRRRDPRLVQQLTAAAVLCATGASLLGCGLVADSSSGGDTEVRMIGVLLVLSTLTTALVPVVRLLNVALASSTARAWPSFEDQDQGGA